MKKITTEVAKEIIGGKDSCESSYQWNGNRCEYQTRCYDKHGNLSSKSATQAGSTYYCQPK
ncbi:DUF4762 family protein [Rahnella aquatilis]|uniref:Uncharacterized protein n=1 Tax=Rahnella aquatilis (strain ATCC 33071 / DSM 4594 / JCM 1683 / NBRC 105701 / NCIMB 13365 / CIP 78.65) TaxID=745277 RepID=H2J0H1_RAHAC|nr:DUF4762 family protein [Rahnella aquatilis]AEX50020.1 hypothetical protein Rahaq2_0066 [Rahnella aquatilis CIP 78.65 = ATCC 33071]KFD00726.1 hypothetical protein GRAQ_04103 [Rahnella aquatilis CIP 78.65 = ATCC 33071]